MKSLLQAAAFLTASAGALVLPPVHSSSPSVVDGYAVAGTTATEGASVYLSIPCPGCFVDPTEELDIELKIEPSSRFCQSAGLTLNGARLDNIPSSILFKTNASTGPNVYVVAAGVDQACLDNRVTLLTLRVDEIVGHLKVPPNIGFSVSFEQGASPKILRLEHNPIANLFDVKDTTQWMQAQENPDVVIVAPAPVIDAELPNQVQEELRRLHEIKARIGRLVHQHMRQEQRILRMITQDFNACSGARCYLQTAIAKAPDFFELVKAHFKHRPDWSKLQGHKFGSFQHPNQVPELIDTESLSQTQSNGTTKHDGDIHSDDHFPEHDLYDELGPEDFPPPPPPFDQEDHTPHPPHIVSDGSLQPSPKPHEHNHQQPCHYHGRLPAHGDGRGPLRHCRPHFFHHHGPRRHPIFFSVGTLVTVAVVACLFLKFIRAKTNLFQNDRCRRDCAARREECRNRAAYRRAAMQHRWKQWWSQFRRPESTADYEEKRARILNQEDALEDVMQSEIRDLRRAHEIVGDMMRAEEGRQRLYHEANFGSSSASSSFTPGIQSSCTPPSQTTEPALPLYQPPPPSYDLELEGELTVVDGFSYTPSATDSTPDSSVIDCNSRMSFDTDTTVTK